MFKKISISILAVYLLSLNIFLLYHTFYHAEFPQSEALHKEIGHQYSIDNDIDCKFCDFLQQDRKLNFYYSAQSIFIPIDFAPKFTRGNELFFIFKIITRHLRGPPSI